MMGALLPSSPHRLSRDLRCPPPSSLLLSPNGRLGGKPSQWQEGYKADGHLRLAGVAVPTCSPRLTPGQTSPRSSGNSSPPHHSCPHVLSTSPFLGLACHPRTCLNSREQPHPPCPSATAPPCCLSVAQAPSSSARPHLWLLTARSGWQQQQRPDGRTCSEKGQAGGQVR